MLVIKLTTPEDMGGAGGDGTNPEQLFAVHSACHPDPRLSRADAEALVQKTHIV